MRVVLFHQNLWRPSTVCANFRAAYTTSCTGSSLTLKSLCSLNYIIMGSPILGQLPKLVNQDHMDGPVKEALYALLTEAISEHVGIIIVDYTVSIHNPIRQTSLS